MYMTGCLTLWLKRADALDFKFTSLEGKSKSTESTLCGT